MAYRIDYSKDGVRESVPDKTINRSKIIWPVAIISLLLILGMLYPQKQILEKMLIPGDAQVTKKAAEKLILDLQDGEGIVGALQAFCLEIISDAGIS